MHVLCVNYPYDSTLASPEDLLARYFTLSGCAEALAAEGAAVTVLQRFHRNIALQRNGVHYVFHADRHGPSLRKWQIPRAFHRAVRELCGGFPAHASTVVHANGLIFALQLRALRTALPKGCALVAQDHGGGPWPVACRLQRWGLATVDAFFFTAKEQAISWKGQRLISEKQTVYSVMEGSTLFRRQDRAAARSRTGLTGSPVVLWVGRLIALKDPLVVLLGFASALQQSPGAKLYMAYSSEDLLPEVRAAIAGNAVLAKSVTLLGAVPYSQLEDIYNSADYFVLGSHAEGSGYALAEAMACGVVPVVTEIPSFRSITGEGKAGALWQPGDAAAFSAAFLRTLQQPLAAASDAVVKVFQERLSFQAIARESLQAYQEIAAARAAFRP